MGQPKANYIKREINRRLKVYLFDTLSFDFEMNDFIATSHVLIEQLPEKLVQNCDKWILLIMGGIMTLQASN